MREVFKPIKNYENYQISNLGRIKNARTNKFLKYRLNKNGYFLTQLCKDGSRKSISVHRQLAIYFIPNPNNLPEVNHKNGVKTDNRIRNLEWVTHSENILHAFKLGLLNHRGENNPRSKVTQKEVEIIRNKYIPYVYTLSRLAKEYNVSHTTICRIVTRKNWI